MEKTQGVTQDPVTLKSNDKQCPSALVSPPWVSSLF